MPSSFRAEVDKLEVNRQIWLTIAYFVATHAINNFGLLNGLYTIVWFAEKYKRTKVAGHTNDEFELFIHVDTSKGRFPLQPFRTVTYRCAGAD